MGTVHDLLERQGKKGAIEAGLGRKTGDYLFGLPNRRSLPAGLPQSLPYVMLVRIAASGHPPNLHFAAQCRASSLRHDRGQCGGPLVMPASTMARITVTTLLPSYRAIFLQNLRLTIMFQLPT
jgi:hypothetical protein